MLYSGEVYSQRVQAVKVRKGNLIQNGVGKPLRGSSPALSPGQPAYFRRQKEDFLSAWQPWNLPSLAANERSALQSAQPMRGCYRSEFPFSSDELFVQNTLLPNPSFPLQKDGLLCSPNLPMVPLTLCVPSCNSCAIPK